jgi:hypothetical protein
MFRIVSPAGFSAPAKTAIARPDAVAIRQLRRPVSTAKVAAITAQTTTIP